MHLEVVVLSRNKGNRLNLVHLLHLSDLVHLRDISRRLILSELHLFSGANRRLIEGWFPSPMSFLEFDLAELPLWSSVKILQVVDAPLVLIEDALLS